MIHALKSIPWHAWAAGIMGLLLGFAIRSEPPVGDEGAETDSGPRRAARTQSTRRASIPKTGPTTIYLNDLASAPASRCEELFREIVAQADPRRAIELEAVFRRWMELEKPGDLLAKLAAERETIPRTLWSSPFFEAWASKNYAEAVAGTAKDGEFAGIRELVAIRRQDPSFLSGSLQIWNFDDSRVVNALAKLGRDNPELAKGVATCNGGNPDYNADLIAAVARGWSATDPQAALEWVESLDLTDSNRKKALNEVLSTWMKIDLAAATEAIKAIGSTQGFQFQGEPLGFLNTPENAASQIYMAIQLDPFLDVAGFYQRLSQSPIDWEKFQSAESPIDHDGLFCNDPARAAEEAARLPPGKARDFIMSYICGQWADRNPDEATAYAKLHGLRDPYVRNEPSADMIRAAFASPEETFATLFEKEDNGAIPRKDLTQLAEKWATLEPQAAAEWLIAQPESITFNYQSNAVAKSLIDNALGYDWARVDAVGASNWVEELPEGPRKTEAWLAMNHYVGEYCPDLAFSISANLLHDETRVGILEANLKKVVEKVGPPAARALLQTTGLSQEERASLNQALNDMATKPESP